MIRTELKNLVIFACITRLVVFVIQLGSNVAFPDHQADAFKPINGSHLGYYTNLLIGGFSKWDSQYFLYVAKHGYVLETSLAFFPLLPILARLISGCLLLLLAPFITQEGLLLLSMLALNFFCFVQSAILHYRLAKDLLKSHQLSLLIAMLFCINPASIFMSAAYTESLYHMLTMFGLVYLRSDKPFLAALCFCLSAACRSNGMTNVLYLILYIIHVNYMKLSEALQPRKGTFSMFKRVFAAAWVIMDSLSTFSLLTAACIVPYFIFQYYAYSVHCTRTFNINPSNSVISFARANNLRLLTDEPPSAWCNESLPFSYPFIQQHYWGVGFLSYFEIKQIPNFLLATPAVFLTGSCLFTEFRELYIRVMGAWHNKSLKLLTMPYNSVFLLLLTFHLTALLLIGVFFTNVQIITRMIFSSSPLLYWYSARIILTDALNVEELKEYFFDQSVNGDSKSNKADGQVFRGSIMKNPLVVIFAHWHLLSVRTRLVLCYYLSYLVVGTVLFSKFLPWT